MLNFHPQQIQQLQQLEQQKLVQRLSSHFWQHYYGHAPGIYAGIERRVQLGIQRAQAFGLSEASDQFEYLICQFELGDDFYQSIDWAAAILHDRYGRERGERLRLALDLYRKLQQKAGS